MDLLISDTHFGAQGQSRERRKARHFDALLRRLGAGDRLLLLGDIFDVWPGWHWAQPIGMHRHITSIEDAVERGVEVHFFLGNHDFSPGAFLGKTLGICIHNEPHTLPGGLDWEPIRCAHGDEPAGATWSYRLLRRVIRCPLVLFLIRILPADLIMRIGQAWSRSGDKRRNPQKARRCLLRYRDQVVRRWWEAGQRVVVCGHHHAGGALFDDNNVLVNLGDWMDALTWAEIEQGKLRLWRAEEGAKPQEIAQVSLRKILTTAG